MFFKNRISKELEVCFEAAALLAEEDERIYRHSVSYFFQDNPHLATKTEMVNPEGLAKAILRSTSYAIAPFFIKHSKSSPEKVDELINRCSDLAVMAVAKGSSSPYLSSKDVATFALNQMQLTIKSVVLALLHLENSGKGTDNLIEMALLDLSLSLGIKIDDGAFPIPYKMSAMGGVHRKIKVASNLL